MTTPKVIACIIAKNEEAMLVRCLDSIKGIDAIYLSDTGSEDKTVEIAQKYTDKVWTEDKWHGSFCDARNFVLNKAKEELKGENVWVLSIDADEFLHDMGKVRKAVEEADARGLLAVDVCLTAEGDGQKHFYPRLFKLDERVWWEGAAHNHISVKAGMTSEAEITYGYSPAHQKDPNRTLNILEAEVARTGNARETFYLGREYWYRSNYKKCTEIMEGYIKKAHFLPEKADAYLIMARCYWMMGMGEQARENCMKAVILNPNFKEAVMFMAKLSGKGTGHPEWELHGLWWEKSALHSTNEGVLFIRDEKNV